jgi:hypothetical protein
LDANLKILGPLIEGIGKVYFLLDLSHNSTPPFIANLTLLRPLLERAKDIGAKVLKKV